MRFRLILDGKGLTGGHGAAKQRHLDERRVAEVCRGRRRGQLDKVREGETESFHEALRVAPVKPNLSRQEAAHPGLRAMQPGSKRGLGHALGGKPEQALFEVGQFHGCSICQFGIGGKRYLAEQE